MTADELRNLLLEPEGERLEFKRSLPDRRQLAAVAAAFANTAGGTLVIGADEREPERGGLAHPGVAADHARQWIKELVKPAPHFTADVVSLEAGRHFVVVTVEAGSARPYIADGRALERSADRLVPITRQRILEAAAAPVGRDQTAEAIATLAETVERLERRLSWRQQLRLQVAFVAVGAVIGAVAGYLLGIWNPLT